MTDERPIDYDYEQIRSALAKADKEILEMMEQLPDEALLRLARAKKGAFSNVFEQELPKYAHKALISRKPKLWSAIFLPELRDLDTWEVKKRIFYDVYLLGNE